MLNLRSNGLHVGYCNIISLPVFLCACEDTSVNPKEKRNEGVRKTRYKGEYLDSYERNTERYMVYEVYSKSFRILCITRE
jgi:hypothetical protein